MIQYLSNEILIHQRGFRGVFNSFVILKRAHLMGFQSDCVLIKILFLILRIIIRFFADQLIKVAEKIIYDNKNERRPNA